MNGWGIWAWPSADQPLSYVITDVRVLHNNETNQILSLRVWDSQRWHLYQEISRKNALDRGQETIEETRDLQLGQSSGGELKQRCKVNMEAASLWPQQSCWSGLSGEPVLQKATHCRMLSPPPGFLSSTHIPNYWDHLKISELVTKVDRVCEPGLKINENAWSQSLRCNDL